LLLTSHCAYFDNVFQPSSESNEEEKHYQLKINKSYVIDETRVKYNIVLGGTSKNVIGLSSLSAIFTIIINTEYTYAIVVAMTMRTSIFADLCFTDRYAFT
jgi:hypothetical protein